MDTNCKPKESMHQNGRHTLLTVLGSLLPDLGQSHFTAPASLPHLQNKEAEINQL